MRCKNSRKLRGTKGRMRGVGNSMGDFLSGGKRMKTKRGRLSGDWKGKLGDGLADKRCWEETFPLPL